MDFKIAVIGLGYVGLPLARVFAKKYAVVGFDINKKRIEELNAGIDKTLEVDSKLLQSVLSSENPVKSEKIGLYCSNDIEDIKDCNYYIVTVPTHIDKNNKPDLSSLIKASETVGKVIAVDDVVIYESTVYPGATEEDCIPIIEKVSKLKLNRDFYAGYSPERINPGDKEHAVEGIKKITSGSTPEIALKVDKLYSSVIVAGTHLAPTIKVAEAAKVIENAQRDINIAFVNELAKIFGCMNININDVLAAAATKWNFHPFRPGLVGGHCVGVDPYYLAQKAEESGHYPELILTGRRINNSMGEYIAKELIKAKIKKGIPVLGAKVLVLGFTFKENCPDIRNTKVIDLIDYLEDFGVEVSCFDPWADPEEVMLNYGKSINREVPKETFDAIVLAVSHQEFLELDINKLKKEKSIVYDVKNFLKEATHRL